MYTIEILLLQSCEKKFDELTSRVLMSEFGYIINIKTGGRIL